VCAPVASDDLVICCADDVGAPLRVLRQVLNRLDLQLNEAKTHVVDAREASFDFLGFSFRMRRSRKSGKLYPHGEPSQRAIQRFKDRVTQLTERRRRLCPYR
jgi:RNA-directed DNA polymerase